MTTAESRRTDSPSTDSPSTDSPSTGSPSTDSPSTNSPSIGLSRADGVPTQTEPAGLELAVAAEREDELSTGAIVRSAGRGLSWSLFGTLVVKLASFAMALVIARLLEPGDYGAYAVALAATHFVMHVNDAGLIAATVQWRGKIEEMAATAATLAFVFSVVLYGIFWFAAEPFAELAGVPDAAGVVRVLTITILIDGVTAVRAGLLMRTFQQDKMTKANALGFVATATVTIWLAATGSGAYSFAWGQVCGSIITGLLMLYWARLPMQVGLNRAVARRLLAFGIPLAASLGVEALVMNADYVIVGNILGPAALGFYLLAFNVSSWLPGLIGTAVRYVSVAGFSRLSEKESGLSDGAIRTIPLLVTGLMPIAVIMGTLSTPIVAILFEPEWAPAATVLQVLMALTVVRMVTAFAQDILMGAGATKASLWVNLGWAVALIPALLVGTHQGGIHGAAVAHVIVGLVVALPLTALALHRAGVNLAPIARGGGRPLIGGAATFVVCFVVRQLPVPSLVQLLLGGLLGTATFIATGVSRDDRDMVSSQVSRLRRRRGAAAAAAAES